MRRKQNAEKEGKIREGEERRQNRGARRKRKIGEWGERRKIREQG
jgi:hypothetical protein